MVKLPAVFGELKAIAQLDLSYNYLEELPALNMPVCDRLELHMRKSRLPSA